MEDDAYGVTIRQEIERRTSRSVAVGAVYTALQRLEQRGLVGYYEFVARVRPGATWDQAERELGASLPIAQADPIAALRYE